MLMFKKSKPYYINLINCSFKKLFYYLGTIINKCPDKLLTRPNIVLGLSYNVFTSSKAILCMVTNRLIKNQIYC